MSLAWVSDLIASRAADAAAIGDASRNGTDTAALLKNAPVDVFVEASTAIIEAAKNAMIAVENGAHVVWMNAEADLAFGSQVHAAAQRYWKIATSDAGDQHGVLARLLDEVELWGWKVVQAGNIKGFLNEDATPEGMRHEAAKRQLDPRACCAYTDGTKLAIEMAIIANTRGLLVPENGMRGPRAKHVSEALKHFDLAAALRTNDVFAVAKCDLAPGTVITHSTGSPQVRCILRRCEIQDPRVPIWMIHDTPECVIRKPVKKGEVLTFDTITIGEVPTWA